MVDAQKFPYKIIDTSRLGREFAYLLSLLQGFALISPLKGVSHGEIYGFLVALG
jgi:hypothetical protein